MRGMYGCREYGPRGDMCNGGHIGNREYVGDGEDKRDDGWVQ